MCLCVHAGAVELGVKTFQAKIGAQNEPSLRLFRSKLDFKEVRIIVIIFVHIII